MNELQPLIDVGQRLRTALQETIDSCPGLPRRPIEMAKALKVDKNMASRLCSALRADDSVAMLGMLPGALPLKQFLRAVSAGGGDSRTIEAAHATLDEFEALVKAEFDDRTGLNAVVGAIVPEMAKSHYLAAKQAAFRSMEMLTGVSMDAITTTCFIYPSSQDSNWANTLWLTGFYGLRRIRPGAEISQSFFGRVDEAIRTLGVDESIPVFREFCRPSNVEVTREDLPERTRFRIAGSAFGRSSAVDLVTVQHRTRSIPLEPPPSGLRKFFATIGDPTKCIVMDLLVHESLWPDKDYELHIYAPGFIRSLTLTPSDVHTGQLFFNESVEFLGRGIKRLRSTTISRYFEMIDITTQRMGWDPEAFRCYRCQIDYPALASEICLVQTPYPSAGEASTTAQ